MCQSRHIYVLEGAKLIIVVTWGGGGGGHVWHSQERDVIVSYAWGGGHLPPCAPLGLNPVW